MSRYLFKKSSSNLNNHIRNNVYYGKNLGALAGAIGVGAVGGMSAASASAIKDILSDPNNSLDYIKNVSQDAIDNDTAAELRKGRKGLTALMEVLSPSKKDIGIDLRAVYSQNKKSLAVGALLASILGSNVGRSIGASAGLAASPVTYFGSKVPTMLKKLYKKSSLVKTAEPEAKHWLLGDIGRDVGREHGKRLGTKIFKDLNIESPIVNNSLVGLNKYLVDYKSGLRDAAKELKLRPEDVSLLDNYIHAGLGSAAGGVLGTGLGAASTHLIPKERELTTLQKFLRKPSQAASLSSQDKKLIALGTGLVGAVGGGAAGFKYFDDPEMAKRTIDYLSGLSGGLVQNSPSIKKLLKAF